MSVLFIDIGNTRVKWAFRYGRRMGRQRAVAHAHWNAALLARGRARSVEKVIVVSVAGAKLNRLVSKAVRAAFGIDPVFIRSVRRLGGVTTRYREPWRLGTDRLVAAIGGHHLAHGRAVCVVDIGTAMTIDLVDARGVHLGGAIVPGPGLMIGSLLKDTSGIQRRAAGTPGGRVPKVTGSRAGAGRFFARSTRSAIEEGARHACAAVIESAIAQARIVLGETPVVLITGGAAGEVRHLIRVRHRLVPDLVLRGLARLD